MHASGTKPGILTRLAALDGTVYFLVGPMIAPGHEDEVSMIAFKSNSSRGVADRTKLLKRWP